MIMELRQKQQRIVNLILFLLPIFALLFIFRKIIFGGEMFFNGDSILQFYQYFRLVGEQENLIVQEMLAGFPLYGSPQVGWFYLINIWFAKILGFINGYNLLTFINFVLVYLFTYLYARKIKLCKIVSILVAIIFTFSGQLFVWGSLLANSSYYFILPAVLYLAEFLKPKPTDIWKSVRHFFVSLLIGCILGLGWLSGHAQFIVYIHSFLALYFIFLVWQKLEIKNIIRKLTYLIISYGTSLLVGWSQISAVLDLRGFTSRVGDTSIAEIFSSTFLPQDIIHYFLPFWSNPIIKTSSPIIYLGILPFIILIFGLISWKQMKVNRYYVFSAIVFIGSLLLSITYSPLALLLHKLPLFDSFRGAQRIMFIGNFGAALLIGMSLDYLINNRQAAKEKLNKLLAFLKRVFLYCVVPLILFVTIIKLFFYSKLLIQLENYFLSNIYSQTAGLPQKHYLNLINNYLSDTLNQVSIGNWQVICFFIFSLLAYYLLKSINKLPPAKVLIIAVVIIVLNFSFVYANYYLTVPSENYISQSATAEFIKKHNSGKEPARLFSLFSGLTEYNELVIRCPNSSALDKLNLEKSLLTPNLNLQYGLASPDGYENFMNLRLAKILAYIGSDRSTAGNLLAHESIPMEERLDKFISRKNILRSMNVRYVISHYRLLGEGFTLLNTQSIGDCQTEVNIYELSDSWPRYFLTNNVIGLPEKDFYKTMDELQFTEEIGRVVLETEVQETDDSLKSEIKSVTPVIEGDRMLFIIDAEENSILYINNTWLPGWRAMVDGQSVEILKANYAFMAIPVVAGQHNVVLTYTK